MPPSVTPTPTRHSEQAGTHPPPSPPPPPPVIPAKAGIPPPSFWTDVQNLASISQPTPPPPVIPAKACPVPRYGPESIPPLIAAVTRSNDC